YYIEKIFWTLSGYLKRIYDLFRLPFYDSIYIFLWVTPFGLPIFEFLYTMANKKIIYDIDDLVFLAPASKANKFIARFKGKSKPPFLMRKASHVITCTPYLTSYAEQFNSNITDISSTINTDTYIPRVDYQKTGKLVLGWSGSHSTVQYLYLLKDVLLEINKTQPFKLVVIGSKDFEIKGLEVECLNWNLETEVKDLQQIDIGLYPLPDEQWVMGKSGLKALQYMALGIPTIATAIGANYRVIEDKVSGYLVKTPSEWKEKILILMSDADQRKRIGIKGRARVEEYYSIKANRDTYLTIIKHVVGKVS
ncbi:MAG TPA: glycosyltransferase family 4 protein, partial [Cytophagaceae bacterium]|nr:glycosyltransferase family 4 protein [Cytophagaceae bacterium]